MASEDVERTTTRAVVVTPEEALNQFQEATGLRVFAVLDPDGTVWWAKGATSTFECTVGDRVLHVDELAGG